MKLPIQKAALLIAACTFLLAPVHSAAQPAMPDAVVVLAENSEVRVLVTSVDNLRVSMGLTDTPDRFALTSKESLYSVDLEISTEQSSYRIGELEVRFANQQVGEASYPAVLRLAGTTVDLSSSAFLEAGDRVRLTVSAPVPEDAPAEFLRIRATASATPVTVPLPGPATVIPQSSGELYANASRNTWYPLGVLDIRVDNVGMADSPVGRYAVNETRGLAVANVRIRNRSDSEYRIHKGSLSGTILLHDAGEAELAAIMFSTSDRIMDFSMLPGQEVDARLLFVAPPEATVSNVTVVEKIGSRGGDLSRRYNIDPNAPAPGMVASATVGVELSGQGGMAPSRDLLEIPDIPGDPDHDGRTVSDAMHTPAVASLPDTSAIRNAAGSPPIAGGGGSISLRLDESKLGYAPMPVEQLSTALKSAIAIDWENASTDSRQVLSVQAYSSSGQSSLRGNKTSRGSLTKSSGSASLQDAFIINGIFEDPLREAGAPPGLVFTGYDYPQTDIFSTASPQSGTFIRDPGQPGFDLSRFRRLGAGTGKIDPASLPEKYWILRVATASESGSLTHCNQCTVDLLFTASITATTLDPLIVPVETVLPDEVDIPGAKYSLRLTKLRIEDPEESSGDEAMMMLYTFFGRLGDEGTVVLYQRAGIGLTDAGAPGTDFPLYGSRLHLNEFPAAKPYQIMGFVAVAVERDSDSGARRDNIRNRIGDSLAAAWRSELGRHGTFRNNDRTPANRDLAVERFKTIVERLTGPMDGTGEERQPSAGPVHAMAKEPYLQEDHGLLHTVGGIVGYDDFFDAFGAFWIHVDDEANPGVLPRPSRRTNSTWGRFPDDFPTSEPFLRRFYGNGDLSIRWLLEFDLTRQ